jgi:hypothetical protein
VALRSLAVAGPLAICRGVLWFLLRFPAVSAALAPRRASSPRPPACCTAQGGSWIRRRIKPRHEPEDLHEDLARLTEQERAFTENERNLALTAGGSSTFLCPGSILGPDVDALLNVEPRRPAPTSVVGPLRTMITANRVESAHARPSGDSSAAVRPGRAGTLGS